MKRFAAVLLALAAAAAAWTLLHRKAAESTVLASVQSSQQVAPETAPTPRPGSGPAVIPLTLPSGKVLQTEVMVKDEDRMMGLMFRPSLPLDHGMLFIFDELGKHTIW